MTAPRTVTVTERQLDVLVELCRDGATNRQIARRLNLAEDTVKVHIRAILAAFGKQDRSQVICAVLRREVVPEIGPNGIARWPQPRKPIQHGTWSGFVTHHRRDIPVCDDCQRACDDFMERRRQQRKRAA